MARWKLWTKDLQSVELDLELEPVIEINLPPRILEIITGVGYRPATLVVSVGIAVDGPLRLPPYLSMKHPDRISRRTGTGVDIPAILTDHDRIHFVKTCDGALVDLHLGQLEVPVGCCSNVIELYLNPVAHRPAGQQNNIQITGDAGLVLCVDNIRSIVDPHREVVQATSEPLICPVEYPDFSKIVAAVQVDVPPGFKLG